MSIARTRVIETHNSFHSVEMDSSFELAPYIPEFTRLAAGAHFISRKKLIYKLNITPSSFLFPKTVG